MEHEADTRVLDSVDDPSVADPLSDVTRQERKAFLVASLVSVAVAQGGLVPKNIGALGIDLSPQEVTSLLYLLAVIVAYLLLGFALYVAADLKKRTIRIAARRAKAQPLIESMLAQHRTAPPPPGQATEQSNKELHDRLLPLAALADQSRLASDLLRVSGIRLLFEAYLPLIVGLLALLIVLRRTDGFPGWQWVAGFLTVASTAAAAVSTWRRRKTLRHWLQVRVNRYRLRRAKTATERLKRVDPASPDYSKLQAKAKQLFERALKGTFV